MSKVNHRELLASLVKIDTVGGHEERLANFLDQFLTEHHIEHQIIPVAPGRLNLVAEIGDSSKPTFVLEGHQDVVAIGNLSKWQYPPLDAIILKNRMYGRGTSDMKGGLAAEIITLIELNSTKGFQWHVRLLATVAEESSKDNHMQGAQYFAEHGYVDDAIVMITAEPSSVPNEWLQQFPPQNPFQFSDTQIKTLLIHNRTSEQFVLNYAHKGSITYSVTARGKSAHSSTPELGIDAIYPLINFYQAQHNYFDNLTIDNQLLGKTIAVTTKFNGGNQLNSISDYAELFVKVRTIPEISNELIIKKIKALVAAHNATTNAQISFNLLGNKYPVQSHRDDKLIKLLQQVSENILQQRLPLGGMKAGTDASELVKANPNMTVAIFGPGNMTAHQANEYIDLNIFESFIQIYEETIQRYFN